jgi:cytochrome c553
MSRRTAMFLASLGVAAAAGCYTGPSADLSPAVRGPTIAIDGTEPPGSEGGGTDGGVPAATGLPCDVATLLATSCTSCHGPKPSRGAPNSLVMYGDLAKPSRSDPGQSVAVECLERMKATRSPMPPDGALAPTAIAVLERWIGAGLPRGTCGVPDPAGSGADDAGPASDAAVDAPTVCSSGVTFPPNGAAGPLMHPGKKCVSCHAASGAKKFAMAGTVYPTLHEPNDCNGITKPNLNVLIIDATGVSHSIPVNAAGNFARTASVPLPYRAFVVDGSKIRAMNTPQTDGDCNGCHTERGDRSPGRIMAP